MCHQTLNLKSSPCMTSWRLSVQGDNTDMLLIATKAAKQSRSQVPSEWQLLYNAGDAAPEGKDQGNKAPQPGCCGTWQQHSYSSAATGRLQDSSAATQPGKKYSDVEDVKFAYGGYKYRCAIAWMCSPQYRYEDEHQLVGEVSSARSTHCLQHLMFFVL